MAVQVANLLAQIGADVTQFRQGMNEVDARLAAAGSRAVTVADRVNGVRDSAARATSEAVKLSQASIRAGADAQQLTGKINQARSAQQALVTQLEAQATLARADVLKLRRNDSVAKVASKENIETLGAKSTLAALEAARYSDLAVKQRTIQNPSPASLAKLAKYEANQLVKDNESQAFLRAQDEAQALELGRARKTRAEILLADKRANDLREQAVKLATEDSVETLRLVEQQKKLLARERQLASRSANLTNSAAVKNNNASNLERDFSLGQAVTQNYSNQLAEDAREHQVRALNNIGQAALNAGLVVTGAFTAASIAGSGYNKMLETAKNNTSLTAEESKIMGEAIKKLGLESGADLKEVAIGFQKVENFGFTAAQATNITETAMRSAVATGSDLSSTAELLAKIMVQFGLGTDKATFAMNTLHVAANLSSLEMSQLVAVGGQAFSIASSMGVGFTEASAALVTFTKQGLNATDAMTQFKNDVQKLANPTKAVKEELKDLAKKTGVDLTKSFSYSTLKAKGLASAFSDIRLAAKKGGYDPQQLANKLFPNLRGTIGAMILSGDQGFNQFKDTIGKLDEAFAGKIDPTTRQYNDTLKLTDTAINRAKNAMILMSADINALVAPALIGLINYVRDGIKYFSDLPEQTKKNAIEFGFMAGAGLILLGGITKLFVGIASLNQALLTMTGTETTTAAFGVLRASVSGATTAVIAFVASWGIYIAIAAAIVAAIAYVYKTVDDANNLEKELTKSVQENNLAIRKNAEANYIAQSSVTSLVLEVEKLGKKSKLSKDEQQHMHDLMNRIADTSPNLIDQYDKQGNAIRLIGDAAKFAVKQLAMMGKEAAIAQSRTIMTDLQPSIDRRAQINDRISRLQQMQRDKEVFHPVEDWYPGDTQVFYKPGSIKESQLPIEEAKKASIEISNELRQLFSAKKEIDNVIQSGWNKSKRIIKGDDLKSLIPKTIGPKPTEPYRPDYEPPGKMPKVKKDPRAVDPAEEWRRYIESTEEQIYKLNNLDPMANAKWMQWNDILQKKLKGINSLSKLYDMAANAASRFSIMDKRATEAKSYAKAIESVKAMAHKPKSERLEDIAKYEVGNPSKDKWTMELLRDKLLPSSFGERAIMRPSYLTGNDPIKNRWTPDKKLNYISAMTNEQNRRDMEKANQQQKDLLKKINEPLQKELSPYEQTIHDIELLPELYKKLGDRGTVEMARLAQSTYEAAKAQETLKKEAMKAFDDYLAMWSDAGELYGKVIAENKAAALDVEGFGKQMTLEAYAAKSAMELYGKSLSEIDPYLRMFIDYIAEANMNLADSKALRDYNSQIDELTANIKSVTMVGGEFQKWLMKDTGKTESDFASMTDGKFKGLTLEQYRNKYNLTTDSSQIEQLKSSVEQLTSTKIEMGLISFKTKEAQIAWEQFHTTFNKLSPDVQQGVTRLANEFSKLDKVRKIQRAWQQAATTLESAFDTAFNAVLTKQKSFWDAFEDVLKSAIISIVANEAAKEIVKFIGHVTGLGSIGKEKDADISGTPSSLPGKSKIQNTKDSQLSTVAAVASIFVNHKNGGKDSPMSAGVDILNQIIGKQNNNAATPVFIVGVAPGVLGGGGILNAGGGGVGGGLGSIFGGIAAKQIGGSLGSFGGPVGSLIGAGLGSLVGKLFHFAEGGRPTPNMPAVIGDGGGPEIWIPDRAGTILPNSDLQTMMEGRGQKGINVINTGDNHYYGDADAEMVATKTANKLDRKLRLNL